MKVLNTQLIATTSTEINMIAVINRFYYTTTIELKIKVTNNFKGQMFDIYNSKGKIDNVRVITKGGRYRFESI